MGRLETDTNARPATQTVAIVEATPQRQEITLTSDEGVVTRFEGEDLGGGDEHHTLTGPDGVTTELTKRADGKKVLAIRGPQGAAILDATLEEKNDPRFGMSAPIPATLTIDTPDPDGPVFTRTQARVPVEPAMPEDPKSLRDTIHINGGPPATVFFDGVARAVTTTTFANRVLTDTLDAKGRLASTEVAGLHAVSLGYDALGRLEVLSQGDVGVDQRQVVFGYDAAGNLDTLTDPLGRTVDFDYDLAGRVTAQTLFDAGGAPVHTVGFGYDPKGNLTSLTPPGKGAHVFRYTDVDEESEYDPPDVTTPPPAEPATTFTYNGDGQLDLVERPDGATINLEYESSPETGRLDTVTFSRGTINLDYDAATGNVETITAPGGEVLTLGHDGPLPTSTAWSGTVAGSVEHGYDNFLRVDFQRLNGDMDHDVAFGYDDDGLLTQAGDESLMRRSDNGLLETTTLGSVATTQSYNAFGELDLFAATHGGSTSLYTLDLDRDDLGRVTRRAEALLAGGTEVTSYEYDPAGRLWRVWDGEVGTGILAEEYLYDANGNRLSEIPGGPQVGFYDAQDRLTSYAGATYVYNLAGDLETKTEGGATTTYTYDTLGNLVNVEFEDGRQIEYVIDGQNRRIGKKVCAAPCTDPGDPVTGLLLERAWLYQDQLNPVAELDDQGNDVARFVYGSRPNVPDYVVKGGATYRILSDPLGSPRLVVDTTTGAVVQQIDYDAWGNATLVSGTVDFQPFGFAGGLYDAETGLVRFGVRDYDPAVGRWTAKDPSRFAGGSSNLYSYVVGDPINLTDPSGRIFNLGLGLVGAVVGGAVNGAIVAANGGNVRRAVLVGAAAGALGGLTLNPAVVGALIGAANTAGNIATGNQESDCVLADVAAGALLGAAGGFVGNALGAAGAANPAAASTLGQVGATAGSVAASGAQAALGGLSGFFRAI